mmetsp:Transcript_8005/g.20021  ORF Transcript_8005/g.20021 Transcript_8005/m.20021 type:complete len:342 (+) Transcript_8005:160-1185(+)
MNIHIVPLSTSIEPSNSHHSSPERTNKHTDHDVASAFHISFSNNPGAVTKSSALAASSLINIPFLGHGENDFVAHSAPRSDRLVDDTTPSLYGPSIALLWCRSRGLAARSSGLIASEAAGASLDASPAASPPRENRSGVSEAREGPRGVPLREPGVRKPLGVRFNLSFVMDRGVPTGGRLLLELFPASEPWLGEPRERIKLGMELFMFFSVSSGLSFPPPNVFFGAAFFDRGLSTFGTCADPISDVIAWLIDARLEFSDAPAVTLHVSSFSTHSTYPPLTPSLKRSRSCVSPLTGTMSPDCSNSSQISIASSSVSARPDLVRRRTASRALKGMPEGGGRRE